MPNTLSAKKRVRQDVARRALNRWRKQQVKDAIREFDAALQANDTNKATELLKAVYKRLDRTAAKGSIHKNSAARKKARMAKRLSAATAKK